MEIALVLSCDIFLTVNDQSKHKNMQKLVPTSDSAKTA